MSSISTPFDLWSLPPPPSLQALQGPPPALPPPPPALNAPPPPPARATTPSEASEEASADNDSSGNNNNNGDNNTQQQQQQQQRGIIGAQTPPAVSLPLQPITPSCMVSSLQIIVENYHCIHSYDCLSDLLKFPNFVKKGLIQEQEPFSVKKDPIVIASPDSACPTASPAPVEESDEDEDLSEDEEERMLQEALALSLGENVGDSEEPTEETDGTEEGAVGSQDDDNQEKPNDVSKFTVLDVIIRMLQSMPATKIVDGLVDQVVKKGLEVIQSLEGDAKDGDRKEDPAGSAKGQAKEDDHVWMKGFSKKQQVSERGEIGKDTCCAGCRCS